MISSYTDYGSLLKSINQLYKVDVVKVNLHRDMIGRIYFFQSNNKKYVLKLYRISKCNDAFQTIDILQYLRENGYPAISIVPTKNDEMSVYLDTPEGHCVGILFDFVEGKEPDRKIEIENIGLQIGWLHRLMEKYPYKLINKTKSDYIDDYISIMREVNYSPKRIIELEKYGNELWKRIWILPKGFCHGDLHTGNMLQTEASNYVLLDFDDASRDFPIMDVAYLSDDTSFNNFSEESYDKTSRLFDRFYNGYIKERTISAVEINAIYDFVAIRHFQIIARIVRCQGIQSIDQEDMDKQYEWLLHWKNLCEMKRNY
jgi:Ser/Thr protein kinase RdoA (MazF antagonist)